MNIIFYIFQVEGVYIDTKDEHKQLDALIGIDNKENLCPLCPKKLKMHIKYTVSFNHA